KRQIATHVIPDPDTLPYRPEVLAYLERSRSEGRALVLATAADEIHARAVAITSETTGSTSRHGSPLAGRSSSPRPCVCSSGSRGIRRSSPCSDRKSTRLNSSHGYISYAVFCLKKKNTPFVTSSFPKNKLPTAITQL